MQVGGYTYFLKGTPSDEFFATRELLDSHLDEINAHVLSDIVVKLATLSYSMDERVYECR